MHEINKVISAAAWRLALANFFRGLIACVAALLLALLLARVVERLFGLAYPWPIVAYAAGGLAVLGGVVWAVWARPSRAAVARRVDEGGNLKEALSTALAVSGQQDDPWARVTVESAVRSARGVRVSQAVPIQAPRFWPVVLALALALGVVWFAVPKMDVLGWRAAKVAEEKKQADVVLAKADQLDVKKMQEELEQKLGLDKDKEKTDAQAQEKPEAKDPEAIRRSAIKDLTSLKERLEQLRQGEKGKKLDAIEKNLKQLKNPGSQTTELAKAMAQGDFKKAEEEIEKIREQMSENNGESKLTEEQKQALSDQLDNLSKQLSEMAKNKQDLEKKLQEAGIDPKEAAKSPEAMKEAIEKAQNLSQEQKQELQEAAEAAGQCQSAMDKLGEAASKMAQAAKSGDKEGMEQAAEQMQGEMAQLEQLAQEMSMAEAGQQECQNKMDQMAQGDKEGQCQGGDQEGQGEGGGKSMAGAGDKPGQNPWSRSWNDNQGGGRGGGGLGQGGSANTAQADFEHKKEKDIGKLGSGPTVSTRYVEGESIKGESHAELTRALETADQRASEAIENVTIPREYQDAVKHYFSTKPKGTAAQDAGAAKPGSGRPGDAKPAEPSKPAEPAKDADKK